MAEGKYAYMINTDHDPPGLARMSVIMGKAEIFSFTGEWVDAPHLLAMSYGGGAFMDYDDITEEEAVEYEAEIREYFAGKAAERTSEGGE